jgi:TolB-like protein
MGEVYKARDTRLDRTVAIKILPKLLAADPQFRERFDREARTISQLDHPHICPLYDVGAQDGMAFLVMQCLDGETLANRLARSRLPLADALTIGSEIAAALDCAHRAGIVHRDLKPGNIFLMTPGAGSTAMPQTKLLDFGLAKTGVAADGESALTRMRSPDLTRAGTMIGTVQYMAPEQIEGGKTDARTDIFAFGLVLFEMIAGRRAFEADTQASLMVAVLSQEPRRLSSLVPGAPAWLEQLVGRCLARNPEERWASMAAVRDELQLRSVSSASGSLARRSGTPSGSWRRPVGVGAALVAALATAILIVGWRRGAPLAPMAAPKASLAVLPLRPIEELGGEGAHIGVGIADAILTKLANVRSIRVRPTSAIVAFEGGSIDPVAAGRQLQVDHVLAGTIRRVEDSYRFNLQLVRTSDGVLVWGRQIDISRRGLFGIEDQVSAEVADRLLIWRDHSNHIPGRDPIDFISRMNSNRLFLFQDNSISISTTHHG